jgi:hypothetical protein
MKRYLLVKLSSILLVIVLITSCGGDDESATPTPSITSFTPINGEVGAPVTITGTNFSTTPAQNQVKFGTIQAIVTAATATSLTTTVPTGASTSKISVTVNGQTATSATDFTVTFSPSVISFSPVEGKIGTTVTITGTNFSTTPANNIVRFNGTNATVTSATSTNLTVTVPTNATTGKITVQVNGATGTSLSDFTAIIPPTITSFEPLSADIGGVITITGTNFSTVAANNIVKVNGTTASIRSVTATSIVVELATGSTSGPISVESNGFAAVTASGNFIVMGTYTAKASFTNGRSSAVSFVIGSKGYVGTGTTTGTTAGQKNDFWEYDPSTNTWSQKANFAGSGRMRATGFSVGNKGYIGLGFGTPALKDVWEYDPVGNTWTKKADFAGGTRFDATVFVIGTKAYVGLGYQDLSVQKNDFWEFNPSSNTWVQIADFAGGATSGATGVAIGNNGYVVAGLGSTSVFYIYNSTNNTWTTGPVPFGGSGSGSRVAYVISNKAYFHTSTTITDQNTWEYDASINRWTLQKGLFEGRGNGIGFAIGTKGYVGLGQNSTGTLSTFYEFTPR